MFKKICTISKMKLLHDQNQDNCLKVIMDWKKKDIKVSCNFRHEETDVDYLRKIIT